MTHEGELRRPGPLLDAFFGQVSGLGEKLGALLVQLPPSQAFNSRVAGTFFSKLRERYAGPVVCEPRHVTWFEPRAEQLLVQQRVARVATDPSRIKAALHPGGWLPHTAAAGESAIVYYRLHGSPRKYWSRYPVERLTQWASEINTLPDHADVWCIFDNTASGAAIENALEIVELLSPLSRPRPSRSPTP